MDADAGLMAQVRDGDDAAFDQLMNRYKRPLTAFLRRFVSDGDQAAELAQDVFVKIYAARSRYRPEARFSTWLFQVGANTALKHLRQHRRVRQLVLAGGEDGGPADDPVDPGRDALAELEQRDTVRRVRQALAGLPDKERVALTLRKYDGFSYAEIATAMRCSVGAIRMYLHRGKLRLREALGEPPPAGER